MIRPLRFAAPFLALVAVACSEGPRDRVVVLGLDGIDPATVELLMAEGKLPNFARLRNEGNYAPLRSMRPLWSPVIWTTIATGRTPDDHGITDFTAINERTGEQLPVTSRMRRTRALWNISTDADREVAVVGWWATWPAESVNGAIVSDHFNYHFLFRKGIEGDDLKEGKTHPASLVDELGHLVVRPEDVSYEWASEFVDVSREEFDRPFAFEDELAHFRWALAGAETNKRIGLHLLDETRPDALLVYVEGTDSVGHLFGHLFRAGEMGDSLGRQKERFGRVVEEMYRYADELVGEFMDAVDERTTLVVLSDHGFRLGELPIDPSQMGDFRRVRANQHRMDGVLYLYGHRVKPGKAPKLPTILDIAPTLLALLGIPPSDEMPGRVLTEALDIDEPQRIASYETGARDGAIASGDGAVDEQILDRLKSLGYIDDVAPSDRSKTVMATILYDQGRLDEARAAFERLIAERPGEPELHVSLAGVLGDLSLLDEARAQLDVALAIDPDHVGALHNLAVIHEREGEPERAMELYRRAVAIRPDYAASRVAITRLVQDGAALEQTAALDPRVADLTARAETLARSGRYDEAMQVLDEAEALSPSEPIVYQYRSNVAYLMGDRDEAIAALRRGLELAPDYELFRENLRRLGVDPDDRR